MVIFEIEDVTVSLLDEDGTEVWEPHQIILSGKTFISITFLKARGLTTWCGAGSGKRVRGG